MAESHVQRKRTGRQTAALLALLSVGTASTVSAQASPSGTQELEEVVTRGMTVWITDSTGREQKARILDMSDDIVTATTNEGVRRLPLRDVLRVRARRPDSLINGALIGAGVAVASGLALCRLSNPGRTAATMSDPCYGSEPWVPASASELTR